MTDELCNYEGCHNPQRARGYCETHYRQLRQTGELNRIRKLGDLSNIRSFWQYDDRVVARLHGFKDVNDYYQRSSSRQFLKSITVPVLLIQAEDDPFMTQEVLPSLNEVSASVELEFTPKGGHVGFVSGRLPLRPVFWLETRIPAFFDEKFKQSENG
jgi:predicted alpha/beta-fold hydrolase